MHMDSAKEGENKFCEVFFVYIKVHFKIVNIIDLGDKNHLKTKHNGCRMHATGYWKKYRIEAKL